MLKTIPTYVIDGLLESGKTSFIKDTIASDDFFKKGRTLVLAGEDGMIEYDEAFNNKYNTVVEFFDSQEDFTSTKILELINKYKPQRVVVELNGMWDINTIEFPTLLKVYQFINFIDYKTFPVYFANMRQKYLDIVKQADVVCFINVKDEDKDNLETYSASFRLTNSNAQYMIMDSKGQFSDAFKVILPYDVDAPIIKINPDDFGIFYIDTFDHKENYDGKEIEFDAMVVKSPKLPRNSFIAGRLAMTCCSNDIQLYGHLCKSDLANSLKDRSFVHIIGKISYEYSEQYGEEECVIYSKTIREIEPLPNPVLDLTK